MSVRDEIPGNGPDEPYSLDQWVETLVDAHADLHTAQQRIDVLEKEIAQLKKENAQLKLQLDGKDSTAKLDQPFSMRA